MNIIESTFVRWLGGGGKGGGTTLVKNIKAFTIRSQKEVVEKR